MKSEQARGKPVDKRADIWAFGVVLYEMVTGRLLFHGEDISHTLAAVIMKEPDLEAVPPKIRRVLQRCLEKDPKKRLRDMSGVDLLLDEGRADVPPAASHETGVARWLWPAAAAVLALALGALAFVHFRQSPPALRVLRYPVAVPENSQVQSFAISPDGRYVVIAAAVNGKRQLWLRPLYALQALPMPFTEDAVYPFWSPDSRFVGFFAQNKLKKVAVSGGPSQSLCDVPQNRGGSWNGNDLIVFSPGGGGPVALERISAAGGVPTEIGKTKGDFRHPVFLPDGRHFLYLARWGAPEKSGIYISSLDGRENRRLLADASGAVYAPRSGSDHGGHILFVRDNNLMAQPFDASSAQLTGDVFPVAEGVSLTTNNSYAPVSVSDNGMLLFATGGGYSSGISQIGWYDRTGKLLSAVGTAGTVGEPAISPDEKSIVYRRGGAAQGTDIWLRDLSRGSEQRFTTDPSLNFGPIWSPKGDRILFGSNRGGNPNLYLKSASGSGQDELLLKAGNSRGQTQWSKDGRFIVYFENDPKTRFDLWVLPLDSGSTPADRKPFPFLQTEFEELFGQLSPDSHWMAYTSNKSGRREVYVRPFPKGEGEWPISISGGEQPRWRGDGKEMFFAGADGKMMAVAVKASASVPGGKPSFEAGAPVALFDVPLAQVFNSVTYEYDVTADGKRFLLNPSVAAVKTAALTMVVNWQAGLKK